uniref:RBBP9/YdeN family alpha/beta hydrolase n=1 Tax=Cellulomonas hominis TaxID=156981 RepID=UPI0018AB9E4A|nr:alpha/beta hydrolase [Cellulomonas hominis]
MHQTSPARVVVLHGYQASPDAHWFTWLADDLRPDGVDVTVPALPDPDAPVPAAWLAAARAAIGVPDERTVVVGHSLGCVTALHALSATPGEWRLGGLVLASGFDATPSVVPEVAAFTAAPPDHDRVAAATAARHVVGSDDDVVVEPALTRALAERLSATFDLVPGGGHLLARDGFTTLPVVRDRVRAALGLPPR